MSGKSRRSSSFIQKPRILVKKNLRFNEENIYATLHPVRKDYGLMSHADSNTPFPRHSNPVPPEILGQRLERYIKRANRMLRNESTDDDDDDEDDDERLQKIDKMKISKTSLPLANEERRHSEFIKKRKQFHQAEFIITQQKSMSSEVPDPGPSIGNNWRIVEYDDSSIVQNVQRLTSYISNNSDWKSSFNYDTLDAIVRQSTIKPFPN